MSGEEYVPTDMVNGGVGGHSNGETDEDEMNLEIFRACADPGKQSVLTIFQESVCWPGPDNVCASIY